MQKFPSDVLNQIREHLEAEKKRVSARIRQLSAQDPFSDPDRTNDNAASDTEATEESSHDRFSALIDQLTKELSEIDATLSRISGGQYGFCTVCHELIDTDRLAILPTATFCLACEAKKKK